MGIALVVVMIVVIHASIAAAFCACLAAEKNRNSWSWFFLGAVFGLIALIAIVGMPRQTRHPPFRSEVQRACPFCPESVKPGATVCPHCQRDIASTALAAASERLETEGRRCPECMRPVAELATVCSRCRHDLPPLQRCAWRVCDKAINPTHSLVVDDGGQVYCSTAHARWGPTSDEGIGGCVTAGATAVRPYTISRCGAASTPAARRSPGPGSRRRSEGSGSCHWASGWRSRRRSRQSRRRTPARPSPSTRSSTPPSPPGSAPSGPLHAVDGW